MNVLVLGAAGMLGHKLMQALSRRHRVTGTVRQDAAVYAQHPVLGGFLLVGGVRAEDLDGVSRVIAAVRPAAVLNCIGVIKQRREAQDPIPAIEVNALFPHRLAQLCSAAGARLIHFSTDCVFSGRKGHYAETDASDAEDLYGRTKSLGEVGGPGCLTLRSSIIGRELGGRLGLVEWLIGNRGGRVSGYARAIYSGFTTAAMSDLVGRILERHPGLEGVRQAAAAPISKYDLLVLLNDALRLGITIARDEAFACDRSLDGSSLRAELGVEPPSWPEMVRELALDPTPYESSQPVPSRKD